MGLPCGQVVGIAQQFVDRLLDRVADHVFPTARLVVGVGPRELQDVGEEALGEAMPADDSLTELLPRRGQVDAVLGHDQAFGFEPLHHLAHRRAADLQPFGDAGLDDLHVVLAEFEDAFAVLLERRMVLSVGWHDPESRRIGFQRGQGSPHGRGRVEGGSSRVSRAGTYLHRPLVWDPRACLERPDIGYKHVGTVWLSCESAPAVIGRHNRRGSDDTPVPRNRTGLGRGGGHAREHAGQRRADRAGDDIAAERHPGTAGRPEVLDGGARTRPGDGAHGRPHRGRRRDPARRDRPAMARTRRFPRQALPEGLHASRRR